MARPPKHPDEKASVIVTLRLTPVQAAMLDAVRGHLAGGTERPEYVRGLIDDKYRWAVRYGSMPPVPGAPLEGERSE